MRSAKPLRDPIPMDGTSGPPVPFDVTPDVSLRESRIDESCQFIIPYIVPKHRTDELRWCLRSIHANYRGTPHVTLIGDRPDWYCGHWIAKPRLGPRPFRRYHDTLSKIDLIRQSEEVRSTVIWCMDDCYFLRPFTMADYSQGRINGRKPASGSDEWSQMLRLTADAQRNAGLRVLDFSCHLPQMINRDRWNEMFERFEMAKQPLVWESMYGSMFAVNPQGHKAFMLRLRNAGALQQHQQRLDRSWLLNHTHEAWSAQMRQWLSERLLEPCTDERY